MTYDGRTLNDLLWSQQTKFSLADALEELES